jgi:hypothetical protein
MELTWKCDLDRRNFLMRMAACDVAEVMPARLQGTLRLTTNAILTCLQSGR